MWCFGEDYRIIERVPCSDSSDAYRAESVKYGGDWILKRISKRPSSGENYSLLDSPDILKRLKHSALPRIADAFEDEEHIYLARKIINGDTIESIIPKNKGIGLSEDRALVYAKKLCGMISYLHSWFEHDEEALSSECEPIIFGNCEPSNIVLCDNELIFPADFGVFNSNFKNNSRSFAAPEQLIQSPATDVRSDIYSFGATIYFMLTGRPPSRPAMPLSDVSLFVEISDAMNHIVMKCLCLNPDERYQSMQDLLSDFNNIDRISSEYTKSRAKKRMKFTARVAVVLLLFATAIVSGFYIYFEGIYRWQRDTFARAEADLHSGRINDARDYYDRLTRWFPSQVEFQIGYAKINFMLGENDENKRFLIELLERFSEPGDEPTTLNASIHYWLGKTYNRTGETELAEINLEKAFMLDDNNSNYSRDLVMFYIDNNRVNDESIKLIEEILNAMQGYDRQFHLALSYEINGDLARTVSYYKECFDADDLYLRADAYIRAADIYDRNPSLGGENKIDYLEQANLENLPMRYERLWRLGKWYLESARAPENADDIHKQLANYEMSLENYLAIKNEYRVDLDDYLDISYLYHWIERLNGHEQQLSKQILDEAFDEFGSHYRISHWRARLAWEAQDASLVLKYANETKRIAPTDSNELKEAEEMLRELSGKGS